MKEEYQTAQEAQPDRGLHAVEPIFPDGKFPSEPFHVEEFQGEAGPPVIRSQRLSFGRRLITRRRHWWMPNM